jgi:cobalamin synthase
MLSLPLIAGLVLVLIAFGLFQNPLVILVIFALWLAVSLWNKRRFGGKGQGSGDKPGAAVRM